MAKELKASQQAKKRIQRRKNANLLLPLTMDLDQSPQDGARDCELRRLHIQTLWANGGPIGRKNAVLSILTNMIGLTIPSFSLRNQGGTSTWEMRLILQLLFFQPFVHNFSCLQDTPLRAYSVHIEIVSSVVW